MRGRLTGQLLLVCWLAVTACGGAVPTAVDSGGAKCVIDRLSYAAGALNPADSCQICNPSLAVSDWTSQPDLTDCSASQAGTYCQLGQCVEACGIGGLVVLAGAANPDNSCQVCAPAKALNAWSANASCSDAGTPDSGEPDAGEPDGGDAGPEPVDAGGCIVGGNGLSAGELLPGNPCQSCQPSVSTTSATPVADGTSCNAGGNVCVGGACMPGCYVDQALIAPHQFESNTQDACCNPALSIGAWTPGFQPLPAISIGGASSLASAAVTSPHAQLIVGTSLGGLDLLTQQADGAFSQTTIVSGASSITAVAATDVSGDGLVDLLYLDSSAPTLIVQSSSQGFGAPKSWPAIADGGGLWAENTSYGAQVLSFDPNYSFTTGSYVQPQVDASGHLLDTCQASGADCTPIGLAFGSFRNLGGTEFVMTCFQSGNDYETLYGSYNPAWCDDGGWEMGQFIEDDFATGAVYGPIVAAGDLNGDGYSEVAGGGSAIELDLLMNWGPKYGTFFSPRARLPLPGGSNVTGLQFANLRGDAGGTLVALDTGNSALDVFYPPPPYDAGVDLTASYHTASPVSALAIGDFDGDGRPDVAVLSPTGVQVFQRQCP
jgi:hypothetical protein